MRWNIVIGGQLLSKSFRGLRSPYSPEIFGREGMLVAIVLVIMPFVLLWLFNRVLPIFGDDAHPPVARHDGPPAGPGRRGPGRLRRERSPGRSEAPVAGAAGAPEPAAG